MQPNCSNVKLPASTIVISIGYRNFGDRKKNTTELEIGRSTFKIWVTYRLALGDSAYRFFTYVLFVHLLSFKSIIFNFMCLFTIYLSNY